MEDPPFKFGQKKHDRTILSASTYWLTKLAYAVAPDRAGRFMREKGFAVKPYPLSAAQRTLQQQAHSFDLELNHNKIKVFEWGSGPVVLLVHGWAGRALQLDALINALLNDGYKVAAFDQKGHGESSSRFSSYPEMVLSTNLVTAHYGESLHGVVAHSIGANSMLKVSENFAHTLRIAAFSPVGDFMVMLEKMRMRIGIDEKLFMHVIRQIEIENNLRVSDLNKLDYNKIARHQVLLVHDRLDRINKVSVSQSIHQSLPGSSLMQTEMLGHSRILGNQQVVERVVAHLKDHTSQTGKA